MKITLSCIVGNEEQVIERFIRSFAPLVSSFVFVRAIGNLESDDTCEIAQKVCKELGKSVEFGEYINQHDFPHVDNFGAARQISLEIAQKNSDYVIWADADDLISHESINEILEQVNSSKHQVYLVPYHVQGDKQIVLRERIIKSSIKCHWKFAIHEQLQFDEDVSYRIIKDAFFLHAPLESKSSSSDRNSNILNMEISEIWRSFFYLAEEHFLKKEYKNFARIAKIALAIPNLDELARYELLIKLAQIPNQDSKQLVAEAFALMPDRREALALLINHEIIDGNYEKALVIAKQMIKIPKPTKSYWTLVQDWYGWKGEELYRQCLRLNGEAEEAEADFQYGQDEDLPTFSIIHATLDRPEMALAIREMWMSRARHPENVEYIYGLHSWDEKSFDFLKGFKHTITELKGSSPNYDVAAGESTNQIIIQAQDDCYPPQDWDVQIAKAIGNPNRPVYLFTSDGCDRTDKAKISVNSIMTRSYMELKASRDQGENGFFHRGYTSMYCDTENTVRAILDSQNGLCELIAAPDIVILHDHPFFNPSKPWDSTYETENSQEHYKNGGELFNKRNPNLPEDILK